MSPDSQAYKEVWSSVQTLPAFAAPPLHQSNQHFVILFAIAFPPSCPCLDVPLGGAGDSRSVIPPMVCSW